MQRIRGITLLELLATLAVAMAAMSIAVPAWNEIRDRVQARAITHAMTASLISARTYAVSRRVPVAVCPSRDGTTCLERPVWDDGWIVFEDPLRLGQPPGPSNVLGATSGSEGLEIRSTAGRTVIRYQPDGRSAGSNATWTICRRPNDHALASVIVNNSGRVRTERTARQQCQ